MAVDTLDASAIPNQDVLLSESGDQFVQLPIAVTTREEKVRPRRKSANMSKALKLFPQPDPFPLHKLQGRLLIGTISQTRDTRNLSEVVDLPRFAGVRKRRHAFPHEVPQS